MSPYPYYYYPYGAPLYPNQTRPNSAGPNSDSPEKQSTPYRPEVRPDSNSSASNLLASMTSLSIGRTKEEPYPRSHYQQESNATVPELSQRAQNVISALRAMPPQARRRQLDSGLYNDFSPGERATICQESPQSLTQFTEKEHNSCQLAGNRN